MMSSQQPRKLVVIWIRNTYQRLWFLSVYVLAVWTVNTEPAIVVLAFKIDSRASRLLYIFSNRFFFLLLLHRCHHILCWVALTIHLIQEVLLRVASLDIVILPWHKIWSLIQYRLLYVDLEHWKLLHWLLYTLIWWCLRWSSITCLRYLRNLI